MVPRVDPPTIHQSSPQTPMEGHSSFASRKANRPLTFRSAIYARLDNPFVSLFQLGIRTFQLVFALGSGISYAIELSHGNDAATIIFSQVVFGFTLLTLLLDAITPRSYRVIFMVEGTLSILWLALFGNFYQIYFSRDVDPAYKNVDVGRMKRAVWLDLVNFLLWMASTIFSMVLCCSGTKAMIKGKLESRRMKKKTKEVKRMSEMEEGVVRPTAQNKHEERLPLYEEVPKEVSHGSS